MDGTQKKISFGFSKLKQSSQLVKPVVIKKEEVQYVDSFDGEKGKFSFQGNLRIDEEVKKPLVIPLIGTRTAYDVIKSKLDSRDVNIVEPTPDNAQNEKAEPEVEVKIEPIDKDIITPKENEIENGQVHIKEEKMADEIPAPVSLDVLAAKELLEGIKKEKDEEENGTGRVIVPEDKPVFEGEKESTLEDYENVPVGDYGLALLRGMGWTPKTGIGKENKVVAPVASKVRPKRLGLGAEVALIPPGERPPLKKGSLVKVAVGQYKNDVGVVESLDGDTGSVFVKLQISGNLSLSENVIQTLTKKEYDDIQSNGGPKMQATPKPASEKKYGIVFKDDEPKKSQVKEEEKQGHIISSKHRSEREKYESKRKSRSRSPRRQEHIKKESTSRKSDSSDTNDRSRGRRGYSSDRDRNHDKRSRHRRDSSGENKRKKRRSRDRSSSNEDYKKKQRKGKDRDRSTSIEDYRKKYKKRSRDRSLSNENYRKKEKKRRSRDRSLSSNDSKERRRKRSKSRDRKKKKSHKRSSSSEYEKSRRKDRRSSSSDEELRKKKKKKRKKKSHDSD